MSNTCPQCGAPTVADARFCRNCGRSLTAQLPGNMLTGGGYQQPPTQSPLTPPPPPPPQQPPSRSLYETRINTDGLDAEQMPQTVSFDTVVDRSNFHNPTVEQPFDPKATQYSSANPFKPNESAPTSMLNPQQTVNLSATMANAYDDPSERGTQNITATGASLTPPAQPTETYPPPQQPSQPLSPSGYQSAPAPPIADAPMTGAAVTGSAPLVQQRPTAPQPLPGAGGPPANLPPGLSSGAVAQPRKGGVRGWQIGLGVFALLLIAGGLIGAFLIGRKYLHHQEAPPATTPTPFVAEKKSASALFSEADALIASGDIAGALSKLREAVALDPANAEAHQRLGDALVKNGSRQEAIDTYRAAIDVNPQDANTWRTLAGLQYEGNQFTESIASYRQYIALSGGSVGEDVQLSLADALRSAGQADEAKAAYQKLLSSSNEEIAKAAKQHISELSLPQSQLTPIAEATRVAARNKANQAPTPQPVATITQSINITRPTPVNTTPPVQPTQAPQAQTPAEHYRRGVELWGSNRAAAVREFLSAQGNADAAYYLGLNIAEGRDPSTLGRAQLVSALYYFQVAERGSHAAQARRYAEQLGKEYDKRQGGK